MKQTILGMTALLALTLCGCSKPSAPTILKHYAVDDLDGLITQTGVTLDSEVSSDGSSSLRIDATTPTTVRLYETGDIDVSNAFVTYQAMVRTAGVEGKVYLEMWCQFAGEGAFFSRSIQSPLTGTTDWSTQQTPFALKQGENPTNFKLNLVIEGKGTVWIDDINLLKAPLK